MGRQLNFFRAGSVGARFSNREQQVIDVHGAVTGTYFKLIRAIIGSRFAVPANEID